MILSAAPSSNPAMVRRSKRSEYIKFKKILILYYFTSLIKAKTRSSGLDDLGLAPFDAIVAFSRPNAFAGIVWCLEVLADPQTRICLES